MSNEKIQATQLWAWVLTAMSGPLAWISGRNGWPAVLLTSIVCGFLCWIVFRVNRGRSGWSKWICLVQWLWLPVLIGTFVAAAGECWEAGSSYPVVPLTLLLLAVLSAWSGPEGASRAGGVIFWLLALLYSVTLAAGGAGVKMEWLEPLRSEPEPMLIAIFLLPGFVLFMPREEGGEAAAIGTAAIFAVAVALLTAGTLSPQISTASQNSFYQFSQSLSLFGTVQRFESVVSVALTMGHFCLASLLLSAGYTLAEQFHGGWGKPGMIVLAVLCAAAILTPTLSAQWIAAGSLLFQVILPMAVGISGKIKKSEKGEKRG